MSARGELVLRIVAGRDGGLVTWLQTIRTDGIAVGTLKDGHLSLVDPGSRQHLQYRRLERVS